MNKIIRSATCVSHIDIAGCSDYSTFAIGIRKSKLNCFPCIGIPYIINDNEVPISITTHEQWVSKTICIIWKCQNYANIVLFRKNDLIYNKLTITRNAYWQPHHGIKKVLFNKNVDIVNIYKEKKDMPIWLVQFHYL
jgi:hypothetical protein